VKALIYRRKMYHVDPAILVEFNEHFNKNLLPTQVKYGARLVGRWMSKDNKDYAEIFAVWEYDSLEEYEKIENHVRNDEEHVKRVQAWYDKMGGRENIKNVVFKVEQGFFKNTVL
jgi:hypothetical protein